VGLGSPDRAWSRKAEENDVSTLAWIVASGLAMGAISLVGSVTLLLNEATQRRITRPLVAFAAGSLLGGVVSWAAAERFDTSWLLGFAAGNFLLLAALKLALGD
jgi:uncharacterized membrane protein YfcA